MPRASENKLYRTFVRGLITEASPLTYPDDSSYDELNTTLSRKGTRTRRRGFNYDATTVDATLEVTEKSSFQGEFVWEAVAEEPNLNFLVVQKGMLISFFDMDSGVVASQKKSFTIDLNDYLIADWSTVNARKELYQMTSGKGFLFVVGRPIDPILVEYNETTDTISVSPIKILIRDFDGLRDNLANDEEPSTLSKEHHYNLLNQGWGYGSQSSTTQTPVAYTGYTQNPYQYAWSFYEPDVLQPIYEQRQVYQQYSISAGGPILEFYNAIGRYPGNNKQWWVARAEADNPDENIEAGDFLPEVLNKLYSGNNRAPRGHFILDAFKQDRSLISGLTNIDAVSLPYRPEAVTFFSGRAWYAAGSKVYYSQIIDSTGIYKAGLCYQEADPTAEDISDLIDSDGGMVPIPEANRIRKLESIGNGVMVIAQNGVWFISGKDSAFSATNVSLSRVSSIGTRSPMAAVMVDETLYWWSEVGIQALQQAQGQFGPVPGKFGNTNITEQTIQTLYNEIDQDKKNNAKSCYDPKTNRIYWLYNDSVNLTDDLFAYNKILLFDVTLQAFYLWEIDSTVGPKINGVYNDIGEAFSTQEESVVDNTGELVFNLLNDNVVVDGEVLLYTPNSISFTTNLPSVGMAISTETNTAYKDWVTYDATGAEYDSYIETAYELMNDAMREKQTNYVFCHFRKQENSSCKLTAKWDWSDDVTSNRWSTEIEAYRVRTRPDSPTTANLEAFEVVTTKNKVRGSGRAIQFRFGTSESGKNFELLGWSVSFSGNTQP